MADVNLPRYLTERIRKDGTIEGCAIETHFLPVDYVRVVPGEGGYLRIVGDGPGINYEMRLPLDKLRSMFVEMDGDDA